VGIDARNMPVCIQAIARPYAEYTLLAFAHQIERELWGDAGFSVRGRKHGSHLLNRI
jgi:Asp-tRNA(Asn)/Glu-tRNA(Gln) amidotransferase A subunit family amidase